MAADRPKQYLQLGGRTILEHSLDCFLGHPSLKGVVVSVAEHDPYWPGLRCASDPRIQRAAGGRVDAELALQAADDQVRDAALLQPCVQRGVVKGVGGALAQKQVAGFGGQAVREFGEALNRPVKKKKRK